MGGGTFVSAIRALGLFPAVTVDEGHEDMFETGREALCVVARANKFSSAPVGSDEKRWKCGMTGAAGIEGRRSGTALKS